MNTDRWKRTEELFAAVLEMRPARRKEYLQMVCADDPLLREEVESLLASHAQAGDFIEAPATAFAAGLLQEEPVAGREGMRYPPRSRCT